jgi:hypothetical protein
MKHKYTILSVRLYFFHVFEWSGSLEAKENQDIIWVNVYESVKLNFLEADLDVIRGL